MTKVKELLESETDGLQQTMEVRHAPISARLKDGDKALRTLRRRQEERKSLRSLKNLVNQRNDDWDEYCKEWNMEDKKHEAEPFTSTDQMFKAMHDLAGIRVSVYFPTHVEKVVEFLRGEQFRIVQEPSRKGGLSRDFQKVRKLVEQEERDEIERRERMISGPELTFGGYKATHVVIRLRNHEFDKLSRGDDITDIEIQIGTIVMHAWSDIEHDILYKPTDHNKASKDVVQMLDLINGIVMTGEVALQQLASVAAAEAKRKAASRTETADNWHHVVPWFYAYFKEKRNVEVQSEIAWSSAPRYLFEILKATNDHNYGRVEALLDDLKPIPEPEERLPWKLLHSLGSDTFDELIIGPVEFPYTWKARCWATCLVNMINMSFYLDSNPMNSMDRAYDAEPSDNRKRPTFAEFLDILHPTHPQRRPHREDVMIDFCKKVLATECKRVFSFACHSIFSSVLCYVPLTLKSS
ncbi:hypothetical protein CMUS01_12988 [Colletotrichum musicola]|uniref:RelA/SpoT domain-containing protein n=1 Tax=Colletotrichum musicola TaxID=2175873 RepID=A0A8H6JGM1_9PEZI|nr:hypothetical protein CMUS01_12988 [Colletotrichum musicola]